MISKLFEVWRSSREVLNKLSEILEKHQVEGTVREQRLMQKALSLGVTYPVHWREVILQPLAHHLAHHRGFKSVSVGNQQGDSSSLFVGFFRGDGTEGERPVYSVVFTPIGLADEGEAPVLGLVVPDSLGSPGEPTVIAIDNGVTTEQLWSLIDGIPSTKTPL